MKKLVNKPEDAVIESVAGLVTAHSGVLASGDGGQFVKRARLAEGKVALISGGGSGHEPLHAGFVGVGMLDAACPGQVFTSPTPDQMLAAASETESGSGALFIVKNYEGDRMNFDMAREMFERESDFVLVNDDVSVENSTFTTGRRGVAGTLIVEKIVGAAAERGATLSGLKALGDQVVSRTRTMGAALTSCVVPAVGSPTFEIGEGEMEMGVGIHGEPGRKRAALMSADKLAEELVEATVGDFEGKAGGDAIVVVNGFGGTPLMELYIMYNAAHKLLSRAGVTPARVLVGNYVTSLEMSGCSLTISLADDETLALWDAPVLTPALRWGA